MKIAVLVLQYLFANMKYDIKERSLPQEAHCGDTDIVPLSSFRETKDGEKKNRMFCKYLFLWRSNVVLTLVGPVLPVPQLVSSVRVVHRLGRLAVGRRRTLGLSRRHSWRWRCPPGLGWDWGWSGPGQATVLHREDVQVGVPAREGQCEAGQVPWEEREREVLLAVSPSHCEAGLGAGRFSPTFHWLSVLEYRDTLSPRHPQLTSHWPGWPRSRGGRRTPACGCRPWCGWRWPPWSRSAWFSRGKGSSCCELKAYKDQVDPLPVHGLHLYLVKMRKTECPTRATQCSTLMMTFSLTHLAIRLLPNMIMTGPATNQTVKNSVNW